MAQQLSSSIADQVAIDATLNSALVGQTVSDEDLMAALELSENDERTLHADSNEEVLVIESDHGNDVSAILADLDLDLSAAAVVAPAVVASKVPAADADSDDDLLEKAVASATAAEAAVASASVVSVPVSEAPTTAADGSDALKSIHHSPDELLAELEALGTLGEKTGDASAPDSAAPAAATEKKPATPRVPRKHYTDRAERLKDQLGAGLEAVSMLTPQDATMAKDDAIERTLAIIKGMNKKEQNRASNLVEFITGKRASLNTVLDRLLKLLHKDGFLTTGDKGNVMENLLAKPYAPNSARAMGANTVAVFADLMLIKADGRGRYVPNPESVLLALCNQKLGLVSAG